MSCHIALLSVQPELPDTWNQEQRDADASCMRGCAGSPGCRRLSGVLVASHDRHFVTMLVALLGGHGPRTLSNLFRTVAGAGRVASLSRFLAEV